MFQALFLMLCGHALVDFGLQSSTMARDKNRHRWLPYAVPEGKKLPVIWPFFLTSHALMHGGAVCLATGSAGLGVAETAAHWIIDFGKCEGWYGFYLDQALHVACKILWWRIALGY